MDIKLLLRPLVMRQHQFSVWFPVIIIDHWRPDQSDKYYCNLSGSRFSFLLIPIQVSSQYSVPASLQQGRGHQSDSGSHQTVWGAKSGSQWLDGQAKNLPPLTKFWSSWWNFFCIATASKPGWHLDNINIGIDSDDKIHLPSALLSIMMFDLTFW